MPFSFEFYNLLVPLFNTPFLLHLNLLLKLGSIRRDANRKENVHDRSFTATAVMTQFEFCGVKSFSFHLVFNRLIVKNLTAIFILRLSAPLLLFTAIHDLFLMAKKPSQLGIAVMPSQLWLLLLTVLCHLSPERQVTRHGKYYFEFILPLYN